MAKLNLPKRKKIPSESIDCPECAKAVTVPVSDNAKEDQIEVTCPHCLSLLTLDLVVYWSAMRSDLL